MSGLDFVDDLEPWLILALPAPDSYDHTIGHVRQEIKEAIDTVIAGKFGSVRHSTFWASGTTDFPPVRLTIQLSPGPSEP